MTVLRRIHYQGGNPVAGAIEGPSRGLYNCVACGEFFEGADAAHLWINHVCSPQKLLRGVVGYE